MKLNSDPIIQYIGLNELSDEEQNTVKEIAAEYQGKIQREMKTPTSIVIHIKTFDEEGQRKKFGVHIKTVSASKTFEEHIAADWDLARTMHKAFKNMERIVLHRLHTDSQNKPAHSQSKNI